jgi:hypothetical protein
VVVATVGSVIAALQWLGPELAVGVLRVERHGEVTAFDVGELVEIHVEHDGHSGRPRAVWVVVGLPTADMSGALSEAIPARWPVVRRCGCMFAVPVRPGRKVATLATGCPHYEPSRIALGSVAPLPPPR